MRYSYIALDEGGKRTKGILEADNMAALRAAVKTQGLLLVDAIQAGAELSIGSSGGKRLKLKELALFCRQMAAMLRTGVSLVRTLDILFQQSESKKIKACLQTLYEDVQKGDMLSDALRKQSDVFPPLMIAMVESGETGGILDEVMSRLATQYEADVKLRSKITGAMVYPAVVGSIALIAVIGLITFVLPIFVGMYEGTNGSLPGLTIGMLALSDAIRGYWYIFIAVIGAVVYGAKTYFRSRSGTLLKDRAKLLIPVIRKASTKVYAVRFTRTIGNLISSGIPLINAIDITSRVVNNAFIMEKVSGMREDVRKGLSISEGIRKAAAFPPIVAAMVSIGEESGSLTDTLEKVSEYLDEEVNASITKLMSMLEPLMMVVVAALVGLIVIGMLLPIFGLAGAIGS